MPVKNSKYIDNQDNFNLPSRADFGFSLVFDNGINISAENEIPDNFEVFSKTKRVEVLKEAGYTGDYHFNTAEYLNLVEKKN